MKKIALIGLLGILFSCSEGLHPDFNVNVESAKKFLELQGTETDLEGQLALIHNDVQWQKAFHGGGLANKEQFGLYLKGWHDAMEDVNYTAENWLPGVSPENGMSDGSVRSYGKWTGVHTATGKSWELVTYHTWDFKDGLIIGGGDYFDAGGLMNLLASEEMETAE